MNLIGDFLKDLEAWKQTYESTPNSSESREKAAELYEMALTQQQEYQEDVVLSTTEREELLAIFTPVVDGLFAAKNGTLANLRTSVYCDSPMDCILKGGKDALDKYLQFYKMKLQVTLDPFCEPGNQRCGTVPKILWQNSQNELTAVVAGIIDGAYLTAKDTGAVVYSVSELTSCMGLAYYYFDVNDCRKKIDDGIAMAKLIAILAMNKPEIIKQAIGSEFDKFVENNSGFEPINYYYNGRATFEIVSAIIPAGQVANALQGMKLVKIADLIRRAAALAERFNVLNRMLNKVGITLRKTGNNSFDFVKRAANGSIIKVVGKSNNDVLKGLKQKTADFKKLIDTHYNVDYEFVDANGTVIQRGKGDVKLWGKCTDGTGNCNNVDDVAGEVVNKLSKISFRKLDLVKDQYIVNRVKELRQKLTSSYKKSGNFGWAEANITGLNKKEFYSHSGIQKFSGELESRVPDISLKPNPPQFESFAVPTSDGALINRDVDTEIKILSDITVRLGNKPGAKGKVKLFTEREPCASCKGVINQFAEKYPNIELEIIDNSNNPLTNF